MRVALCLSGHLRSFRECFPSLKQYILAPFQPDIFISTYYKLGNSINNDSYLTNLTTDETYVKRDIDLFYKPKKIHIDKHYPINGKKYQKYLIDGRDPYSLPNMFYKIWHANQLKIAYEQENNFVYDLVIRTRTDLKFTHYLNLSQVYQAQQNQFLYVPGFAHWDGICDSFALGNSTVMNSYSETGHRLDDLVNRVPFTPERLLHQNIVDFNLKIQFLDSNFHFVIIRPNGIIIDPRKFSPDIPSHLSALL